MGVNAQMLVKTKATITAKQVLQWATELYEAFPNDVSVVPPKNKFGWPTSNCLNIIDIYCQDGPDIIPEDGETLIEVSLNTRYYGPGYERGNARALINIARWLDEVIPNSEVWYGGDSSGIVATLFGPQERDVLWKHFVQYAHRPYTSFFDNSDDGIKTPICELCQIPLGRNGWGKYGKFASFYCRGCGYEIETHDGGETFELQLDNDYR